MAHDRWPRKGCGKTVRYQASGAPLALTLGLNQLVDLRTGKASNDLLCELKALRLATSASVSVSGSVGVGVSGGVGVSVSCRSERRVRAESKGGRTRWHLGAARTPSWRRKTRRRQ